MQPLNYNQYIHTRLSSTHMMVSQSIRSFEYEIFDFPSIQACRYYLECIVAQNMTVQVFQRLFQPGRTESDINVNNCMYVEASIRTYNIQHAYIHTYNFILIVGVHTFILQFMLLYIITTTPISKKVLQFHFGMLSGLASTASAPLRKKESTSSSMTLPVTPITRPV